LQCAHRACSQGETFVLALMPASEQLILTSTAHAYEGSATGRLSTVTHEYRQHQLISCCTTAAAAAAALRICCACYRNRAPATSCEYSCGMDQPTVSGMLSVVAPALMTSPSTSYRNSGSDLQRGSGFRVQYKRSWGLGHAERYIQVCGTCLDHFTQHLRQECELGAAKRDCHGMLCALEH
jgi:hypothetical protein